MKSSTSEEVYEGILMIAILIWGLQNLYFLFRGVAGMGVFVFSLVSFLMGYLVSERLVK